MLLSPQYSLMDRIAVIRARDLFVSPKMIGGEKLKGGRGARRAEDAKFRSSELWDLIHVRGHSFEFNSIGDGCQGSSSYR